MSVDPVALDRLKATMRAVEEALRLEGVPAETAKRVMNRWLYGHPDGIDAVVTWDAEPHQPELADPRFCSRCGRMISNSVGVTASGADPCEGERRDR